MSERRLFTIHSREYWFTKEELKRELGVPDEDLETTWKGGKRVDTTQCPWCKEEVQTSKYIDHIDTCPLYPYRKREKSIASIAKTLDSIHTRIATLNDEILKIAEEQNDEKLEDVCHSFSQAMSELDDSVDYYKEKEKT